jgi:hypothetical protein
MSYIGNQPTSMAFLTDTFSGNGTTGPFLMSTAPAATSSMLVVIRGVTQDPSTYGIVGNILTFSEAPPVDTGNISVRYLGIPAQGVVTTAYRTVTEFIVSATTQALFSIPSYTVGFLNTYRNGSRLGAADVVASNGVTASLVNPAVAGDLVAFESFYVSSVLNAIPATAGSVGTTFLADNSVTSEKIAPGAVTQADLAANVAGNGPAFSAYLASSGGSVGSGVFTKCLFDTESWDTNSNFASSRFTPTVAGYYQINAAQQISATASCLLSIFKNGSEWKRGIWSVNNLQDVAVSAQVYFNGTTDYAEIYIYQTSGSSVTPQGGISITWFDGFLARAA